MEDINCFKCYGYGTYKGQRCDIYAVSTRDSRVCYRKNKATSDLIKLNNNNPYIELYDMMKEYFKNDVETLKKIGELEKKVI